jgi:hypothetical protein
MRFYLEIDKSCTCVFDIQTVCPPERRDFFIKCSRLYDPNLHDKEEETACR